MQSDNVINSPVDQWNNVKIPRLNILSPFTEAIPGNPWMSVNQTSQKTWSSLTGLMIQQLPVADTSNFTLESSYLDLSCTNSTRIYLSSFQNPFESALRFHNPSSPFYPNGTRYENFTSSFFMDTDPGSPLISIESTSENDYISTPLNLLYGSSLGVNITVFDLFNCSVGTARVESDIICHGSSCTVSRMRRSEIYTQSPFFKPFNSVVAYKNMLLYLPFAMGVPHTGTVSPIDQYLLGSNKPLAAGLEPIAANFSGVTGQVFSERLTTILNTVWQASVALGSIPLAAQANYRESFVSQTYFPSESRTTIITKEVSVYAANNLFIFILLAVALILQASATAGLILKYTATAPDILGYISTMTMENPHINVPNGGNTLDGMERARYLQKVKVQLADVHWDQVEGHLAFRSVDNEIDVTKGKLSKNKLYV